MRTREEIEKLIALDPGNTPRLVSDETQQRTLFAILNTIIVQTELLLDIRELLAQPTLHHDHGKLLDSLSTSQTKG